MELSRKEEYRNKKISIAVTAFAFLVMMLFLIFKNIITVNPSFTKTNSNEITMAISAEYGNNFNENKKTIVPVSSKQEQPSEKKIATDPNSDIMVKSSAISLADNYKTAVATTQNEETSNTENNLPLTTEGTEPIGIKTDSRFGFDLRERNIISTPNFANDTKEEGKVVVEIVVDGNGTVIEANPNGRGTTTSNALLKARAKQMATDTKFSGNQKLDEQRGTITIIFSFN